MFLEPVYAAMSQCAQFPTIWLTVHPNLKKMPPNANRMEAYGGHVPKH